MNHKKSILILLILVFTLVLCQSALAAQIKLAWDANPPVMPDAKGSYEHLLPMPGRYKPF